MHGAINNRSPLVKRGLVWTWALLMGVALLVPVAYSGPDFDRLLASATQRWGPGVVAKFSHWRNLVQGVSDAADPERLKKVNDFFNRNIRFADDQEIWGQVDYWATPIESLGRGAGDCEDFAIAKYFSLREAGVPSAKLRLIYVRAGNAEANGPAPQPHMVLAYYAQPEAEPLILDNLIADIRPASRRPDLTPVFSFNSEGVFSGGTGNQTAPAAGVGRLSRWEDLLRRAKAEGFE